MDHQLLPNCGASIRVRSLSRPGCDPWSYHPAHDHGLTFSERNRSLDCERGLFRRFIQTGTWALLRGYLRRRHDLRVIGGRHLPSRGPFVLVANHSSHLDALSLGASMSPRLSTEVMLLAAGDTFFRSRLRAGLASLLLNARPVWRGGCGGKALSTLRSRLRGERGPILVIFPEGTRSRTGEIAPFKAGVGALVAGTTIPVVPVRIDGAFAAWPADRAAPRKGPVTLTFGPAMRFEDAPDKRSGWRGIAAQLEERVRSLGDAAAVRSLRRPARLLPPAFLESQLLENTERR